MDRNSIDWHGSIPAMTTPFDAQGRIDEKAFAANMDRLLAEGATGFVVGGCTGEFWALSHDERKRLYDVAASAMNKRGTLLVGTGAVTVDETVAHVALKGQSLAVLAQQHLDSDAAKLASI